MVDGRTQIYSRFVSLWAVFVISAQPQISISFNIPSLMRLNTNFMKSFSFVNFRIIFVFCVAVVIFMGERCLISDVTMNSITLRPFSFRCYFFCVENANDMFIYDD